MNVQAYDKVLLHKAKIVERCVARARQMHSSTGNLINSSVFLANGQVIFYFEKLIFFTR